MFEKNGKSYVWSFDGKTVKLKAVHIVRAEENGQIVVEGLKLGDRIVVRGVHDLYEGQTVRALEEFSKSNVGEVL